MKINMNIMRIVSILMLMLFSTALFCAVDSIANQNTKETTEKNKVIFDFMPTEGYWTSSTIAEELERTVVFSNPEIEIGMYHVEGDFDICEHAVERLRDFFTFGEKTDEPGEYPKFDDFLAENRVKIRNIISGECPECNE